MSDDKEESIEYILLENMRQDIFNYDSFILPDLSDAFPTGWDIIEYNDYEDSIDDSSLFNPNK